MPVSPRTVANKKRFALTDLIDPRRLAEFMGWPWEDREVVVYHNSRFTGQTETIKAEETVAKQWAALRQAGTEEWAASPHNQFKGPTSHAQFIQRCVREEAAYQASLRKKNRRRGGYVSDVSLDHNRRKKAREKFVKGRLMPKPSTAVSNISNKYGYKHVGSSYNQFVSECARLEFGLTCDIKTAREILIKRFPEIYSAPDVRTD